MMKMHMMLVVFFVGFICAMEQPSKDLKVLMGCYSGYGAKPYQEDRSVCGKLPYSDTELYCSVVTDGSGGDYAAELLSARFVNYFKDELNRNETIENSLHKAHSQCNEDMIKDKKCKNATSTILFSCFEKNKKKLHVLWKGDSLGWFGSKAFYVTDCKTILCYHEHNYHEHDLTEGFGYYIGASDGFWRWVQDTEVNNLLSDAKDLPVEEFYQRHCSNFDEIKNDPQLKMNYHTIILNNEFEDVTTAEIARRLVHVALCRGKTECDNITVVVNVFGYDNWEIKTNDNNGINNQPIEEKAQFNKSARLAWLLSYVRNHPYFVGGIGAVLAFVMTIYCYRSGSLDLFVTKN